MKRTVIKIIEIYQKTLSPDTGWMSYKNPGGYCKYYPHCSEYGKQAIIKHGVLWGMVLLLWRIARCNPWSTGGIDLP